MIPLAVAANKFPRGVETPGTRLHGKRGTPACRPGEPATYDWRAPLGSAENTACIEPAFAVLPYDRVLSDVYETDAHFVAYLLCRRVTIEGKPDWVAQDRQPRINKASLGWIESIGLELRMQVLVADVDNPDHAGWPSEAHARMTAELAHAHLSGQAAVYVTTHGLRVVQPLARKGGISIHRAEGEIRRWLAHVEESLEILKLKPDWSCDDWTRMFRAPHVLRDGKPYRSPAILPSFGLRSIPDSYKDDDVAPARRPRVRREVPLTRAAARLEPSLDDFRDNLSRVLTAHAKDAGDRHDLSLALAGALLNRTDVPRAQVPALVRSALVGAGWPAGRADEWFKSGEDTLRRWSDGHGVSGLSALPESVRDAIAGELSERRARADAAPVEAAEPLESLEETTRKLTSKIEHAPIGLTVIKAQCGLGKTHAARSVSVARATRSGAKPNTKSALAVPTTELAVQVTADLRAAGVKVTRLYGPTSLTGAAGCRYQATGIALEAGGQSVKKLFCPKCDRQGSCEAELGQDRQDGALIQVGPHKLLAELHRNVGQKGFLFIDEAPPVLDDEVFALDDLIAAERALGGKFERKYTETMAPALATVRAWVETAVTEETGSIRRAWPDPADLEIVDHLVAELPDVPPIDRMSALVARTSIGVALRLGKASQILRAVHRALTRPLVRATVYDRGGRSLAITSLNRDIEGALIGSNRKGEAVERRVVVAGADAHLRLDEYRELLAPTGADPAFHDFAAPDGAPIRRVHLVCDGSRARLASDDTGPIEVAARLVAEWALELGLASVGVVTFKRHELAVLRALQAAAPAIRFEVAHYGAVRGLDRWKDFDAVATIGDPRPNLDAVSRELGGGGAEVESRYERADAHARSELEQAHGRLRTVHRTRPGFALHVGALLPGSWRDPIEYRRPPVGRMRRPVTPRLAELVEAAGGQRAASRAVGRARTTVQGWLRGEGRPEAADVEALRRAGTERRLTEHESSGRKRSLGSSKGFPGHPHDSDAIPDTTEEPTDDAA